MTDDDLLEVLRAAASAVRDALGGLEDWGLANTRPGQYRSDLAADDAAVGVLSRAGLGVVSEESGVHDPERAWTAVLDPLDGSTNASRGIPWFATSICVLDAHGPRAAVVVNQAGPVPVTFEAVRGVGARCDGRALTPSTCTRLDRAILGLNGAPPKPFGWKQYRALGAAALDLCAVGAGVLDAYVDCTQSNLAPWDYLGGMLICREAGGHVADAAGRDLVTAGHADRRILLAAGTRELLESITAARRAFE